MSILYDRNDRTQNRGGFNKVGGFSLMRDGCTTVAYLDHNKTAVFSNEYGSVEWTDMIFRQLLTIDKNDLTNVVYGHYNGTPSDAIRGVWGEMLREVMGGENWKMHDARYNGYHKQGSRHYYDVGCYNWFGSSEPKIRTIGTKYLHCVCCGKKFADLHSYENWLSCTAKCVKEEEKK